MVAMIRTLVFAGGEIHDFKGCGAAIREALAEKPEQFELTYVEDDLDRLVAELPRHDLLVFYYTVGEITDAQKNALLDWVAAGKGYVGIHSAADSFRGCPEYRAMVGGYFVTHPQYRDYQVSVADATHPITAGLVEFMVKDEQYILDYDPRVHVLAAALHQGRAMPVAWTKPWGEGRVFYLALGHDAPACRQGMFRLLLQRGAFWAAGG
jgi:type 1 glutamine amidotransferase